jgi:carbonic anhydrase
MFMEMDQHFEIQQLIDGFRNFKIKYYAGENALFKELKKGQAPKIALVACCDSRVDPALLFDTDPGELFVIRNVANLVPPCEEMESHHGVTAALEYAVRVLEVHHILLLGHTQCGGVNEMYRQVVENDAPASYITKWIELGKPACEEVIAKYSDKDTETQLNLCGQYSLVDSYNNLLTFDWISDRVNKNELHIHAWHFDIQAETVLCYDQKKQAFIGIGD